MFLKEIISVQTFQEEAEVKWLKRDWQINSGEKI